MYSVNFSYKGKSWWRREESLAYISAVEMVDLPVSENQAKFEDEFGSREGRYILLEEKELKKYLSHEKKSEIC